MYMKDQRLYYSIFNGTIQIFTCGTAWQMDASFTNTVEYRTMDQYMGTAAHDVVISTHFTVTASKKTTLNFVLLIRIVSTEEG